MTPFDASAVLLGLGIGALASMAYFAGLGFGIRVALGGARPFRLLILSAALRIAALLGVGWLVGGLGGAWSLLGYAAAFLVMRFVVTTFARPPLAAGS